MHLQHQIHAHAEPWLLVLAIVATAAAWLPFLARVAVIVRNRPHIDR